MKLGFPKRLIIGNLVYVTVINKVPFCILNKHGTKIALSFVHYFIDKRVFFNKIVKKMDLNYNKLSNALVHERCLVVPNIFFFHRGMRFK